MKARNPRCWFILSLIAATLLSVCSQAGLSAIAHAAQKELQKLTVGYTPIAGASLPFFIAVEEKIFQKYGFEILPVFIGGSPLINSDPRRRISHRLHRRRRRYREPAQRERFDRDRVALAGPNHRRLVET